MLLADWQIREAVEQYHMIDPFVPEQVRQVHAEGIGPVKTISFGVSSFGYDFRLANDFKVLDARIGWAMLDPKEPRSDLWDDIYISNHCSILIPPHGFVLGRSVEYWRIPRNVQVLCVGKSTYARNGIILNTTPFEPGWTGHATLEISNTTNMHVKVYAGEGIGQALFFANGAFPEVTYDKRNGKYQGHTEVTLSKV